MSVYTRITCLLGSGLLALAIGAAPAGAAQPGGMQYVKSAKAKLDGAQYLKNAKITLSAARAIALKTCDGKIISQELEKEHGGSGLRYSFDIRKDGVVHEVGVDAKTGKLLEYSIDNGGDEGDGG